MAATPERLDDLQVLDHLVVYALKDLRDLVTVYRKMGAAPAMLDIIEDWIHRGETARKQISTHRKSSAA